jgi:hypothetical protein
MVYDRKKTRLLATTEPPKENHPEKHDTFFLSLRQNIGVHFFSLHQTICTQKKQTKISCLPLTNEYDMHTSRFH